MEHLHKPKRRRNVFDPDSDSETEYREKAKEKELDVWPRFLVVEGEAEQSLKTLSPFLIQKWFSGICSSGFKNITKQRSGALLVECSTKRSSELLLKRDGSNIHDKKIKVSRHAQLNSSKGVIRCADLKECTEGEIKKELAEQGVIDAHRITINKDGKKVPTSTLILTFGVTTLPEQIKVGYLKVRVTPYIPSPMRCFKCQRFGHISKFCKNKDICSICAQDRHEGECKGPKHCVNCKESHESSSKDCPSLAREKEIQRVRVMEKCSFAEAKKKVGEKMPMQQTFAKVLAGSGPTEPSKTKLESMLEKVVQSLNTMSQNLNMVMKMMDIKTQTGASAVAHSSTPREAEKETQKSTPSSGQGTSQNSTFSGGRGTTEINTPPIKVSKSHNSVKPPTAPKPHKHTKSGQTNTTTTNRFSVLQEIDTEMTERPPSSSSSSSKATSPKKK